MVICHRRLTNIYTIVREFMRILARTAFDIPNDSLMSPTDTDHHAYHLTSNMRYHGNRMIIPGTYFCKIYASGYNITKM